MYFALLLSIAAANPPVSQTDARRVVDDVTLTVALERSQSLADQLLEALPEGSKNVTRTRVKSMLDDCKRDKQRLPREGKGQLFEAGVLFNYGELCALGQGILGPERLKFRPHPDRGAKLDEIKFNGDRGQKTSFAETLFGPEELQLLGVKSHDLIDALAKRNKPDAFASAKWKKEMGQFRSELKRTQEELLSNNNLSKVAHEAKLLGIYAKAVSLTVNLGK